MSTGQREQDRIKQIGCELDIEEVCATKSITPAGDLSASDTATLLLYYYCIYYWTTWPYSPLCNNRSNEDGASKHVIERVSDLCHWQLGMHQRTSMTLLLKWFHPRVFAFWGVGGLLLRDVMWRRGEYSECGRLASVSRQIQARTAGRHPTITILDSIWFDSLNPSSRQSTS